MTTVFVDEVSVTVLDEINVDVVEGDTEVHEVDFDAEIAARIAGDLTEAAARIAADALLIPLTQKGVPDGVATLDGSGLVPTAQLPPVSISGQTFDVASEAEMLALAANPGDTAIRSDLDPDGFFVLRALPASTLANWFQVLAPGSVLSVDGRTGTVSLSDRYDPIGQYQHAPAVFSKAGTLVEAVGKARWPVPVDLTISEVRAVVDTAPLGADLILQLRVVHSDTSVEVVTLTIAQATFSAGVASVGIALAVGDYLNLDIIQVGTEIAGWDLTVQVLFT